MSRYVQPENDASIPVKILGLEPGDLETVTAQLIEKVKTDEKVLTSVKGDATAGITLGLLDFAICCFVYDSYFINAKNQHRLWPVNRTATFRTSEMFHPNLSFKYLFSFCKQYSKLFSEPIRGMKLMHSIHDNVINLYIFICLICLFIYLFQSNKNYTIVSVD